MSQEKRARGKRQKSGTGPAIMPAALGAYLRSTQAPRVVLIKDGKFVVAAEERNER